MADEYNPQTEDELSSAIGDHVTSAIDEFWATQDEDYLEVDVYRITVVKLLELATMATLEQGEVSREQFLWLVGGIYDKMRAVGMHRINSEGSSERN